MEETTIRFVRTDTLEIAYEEGGSPAGLPVVLIHGWPDIPQGWEQIASRLQQAGYRTLAPYLRGSHPTRFLLDSAPRVGSGIALAQDAIDFANALGIQQFVVVGHDWGARAAYILGALHPERVLSLAALALAYQPRGIFKIPSFEQSRKFWYQWFMCTEAGANAVRQAPVEFARIQWETWSPPGWFRTEDFRRAASSFEHRDWAEITLNAYRSRWMQDEARDQRYTPLETRLLKIEKVSSPVLMIQGQSDNCDPPSESEGMERHFIGPYRRLVLAGVGHFPHREAPAAVADAVLEHIGTSTARG